MESYRPRFYPEALERRRLKSLPCLASEFFNVSGATIDGSVGLPSCIWSPILRELLAGTRDEHSVLECLRGNEDTLLKQIYSSVVWQYASNILLTIPAACVGNFYDLELVRYEEGRGVHRPRTYLEDFSMTSRGFSSPEATKESHTEAADGSLSSAFVSFAVCRQVKFPLPADRNCNMMPFIFGNRKSLPEEFQAYFDLIQACPYRNRRADETGKVGYLTVHESWVEDGTSQRRGGLHIETPGHAENSFGFTPGREHGWGCGVFFGEDEFEGGIYMASTVGGTSKVWDALVDKKVKGIVDAHGGCEHLRPLLGEGTVIPANSLVWMTDATPHEALIQPKAGYRQFFRVVTSQVTHWYAQHSTPNPKVPVPAHVTIVEDNKFAKNPSSCSMS